VFKILLNSVKLNVAGLHSAAFAKCGTLIVWPSVCAEASVCFIVRPAVFVALTVSRSLISRLSVQCYQGWLMVLSRILLSRVADHIDCKHNAAAAAAAAAPATHRRCCWQVHQGQL
jgi:hypothetical protein